MKNVMKKILACMTGLLAAFALASCSDVDTPKSTGTTSDGYVLTGKIVLGSESGATASRLFSSNSSGRTAITSFSGIENLTYTVSALYQDKKTSVTGTVNDMNYSITLTEAGEWFVSVKATKEGSDEAVLSGEAGCYIESDKGDAQNNPITLYPVVNDDVKGSISLSVSCSSSDVTEVAYSGLGLSEYADEKPISISGTATLTDGVCVISKDDVSPASYEVTFYFNDSIGNTLYKCKENVNVFSGLTTDTWFGTSPHMQYDDDGNYSFVITDALIDGYGTETVPSTDTVLYSYASGAYNYYIANSADVKTSDSTANFTSETNSFCFDADGNVYVLVENDDNGTTSYSIKSNKTGFTETTLTESSFSNYSPSLAIDLAKNVLYVWYCHESELVIYKYPSLISTGNGTESSNFTFYGPSLTIDGETVSVWPDTCMINNEIAYIIERDTSYNDYGSFLFKAALTGTGSLDENNYVSLGLNGTSSASVTDMLYQDGAVYILARNVSSSSSGIYSTGALLRYDVKFGTVKTLIGLSDLTEPVDLSGVKLYTSVYVPAYDTSYQCYTDSSLTTPFYAPADFTWTVNEEKHTIFSSLYTPSLLDNSNATLSTTGFYGPVKFVAIKPRKLVIADDGLAFYTDEDGVLSYKNVNRVVTVDLESFAITNSTETDAIFGENNSAMLNISFENDTDFQEEFNSSSDVFPNLEAKVYYSGNTQGVAPGDSFRVGIPCAD